MTRRFSATGLAEQQILRQVPLGADGDLFENLIAGRAALLIFQPAFEDRMHQFVQLIRVMNVKGVQKFVRQFRQAERLDIFDIKSRPDRSATQRRVGHIA